MIILKKGQSDPKIEDDTAQSLQCFISQLNSDGAFFGLWQGDLVTVGPVRNPPTTFYETKGRNRILNEPFEHHVKLFKRKKTVYSLLIKIVFIMTRHGKWAQTKEKKIIVLYVKYGRCIYSFSLSKKGRVDMCVNIHTCDTAVFFHSFYNTATQSHCAGMTRDLCTFVLHADAEHYNHCYLKYAGS